MSRGADFRSADDVVGALPPGVTVLTAPARSGKTAAALALYRLHLDDLGRPGCLLIVPNAPAVGYVRQRLLETSEAGVLIAPAVTTFAGLAASILAAGGRPAHTLSPVRRRLLLAGIVAHLDAAGELKALAPVADTPGLVSALDASIAELKRAAVEPEALERAIDPRRARDADLLAVYRLYQQHLLRTGRFDVEGLMWLARDVLAEDGKAPLGCDGIAAVAVDGFIGFTPTQLEMLALLAGRVERMLITLPLAEQPRRKRMWFWTQRTLARIREAMPAAAVVSMGEEAEPMAALFDLAGGHGGAEKEPAKAGLSVTILEAADLEAEVRAVARAIKADLAAGAAPGSIAVMARGLEDYEEPVGRILAAHDVPAAPRAARLAACSAVRYVLRLLSLPPRYEFHDVLAAIRNSYFRPAALGEGFDEMTVATAEMAIRTANVLGGRAAYGVALKRLAGRARTRGQEPGEEDTVELGPLAADAGAIERAAAMLESLMGRLERLAAAADVAAFVRGVRELIAELQIPAAAAEHEDDSLVAADLRALRAFDELLEDLSDLELPPGRRGPGEYADLVARSAEVAVCPPQRGESLVTVLDVLDARAVRFEKVYLLGVNERAFPRLAQEQCFIDESDRAAWAGRGVVLDRRSDLIAREMLLFYLAATRAEKGLTVGFLASDASGKPHAPSTFVQELASATEREGIPVRNVHVGPGDFVPPREELSSPADAFNAAVLAAFDDGPDRLRDAASLLGWAAEHRPHLLRRAAFGIFAADRRWRTGQVDAFDGQLDDPRLLEALAERIPGKWTFSATELNSYAQCPWQFFARYLLALEPLVEPEAPMTPAARGSFCHAVLWRVMTALGERAGRPVVLAEVDEPELRAALAQAVEAERRRLADQAVYSALWDVQTAFWERMLWGYLSDQRRASLRAGSTYFELGFGLTERRVGRMDPASAPDPVEIDAAGQKIRLAGKIDRVDRIQAPEGPALLAVDYKTGRVPQNKDILAGRDLQLALYAKAVEALLGRSCAGGVYHDVRSNSHRYFAGVKLSRGQAIEDDEYPAKLAAAMEAVRLHVAGMREGRFDALPDRDCPHRCPYRQVCHFAAHRARRKTGGSPVAELRREGGDA